MIHKVKRETVGTQTRKARHVMARFFSPKKLSLFVIAVALVISVIPVPKASAAGDGPFIADELAGKVNSYVLYRFAEACFMSFDIDNIPSGQMGSWDWFDGASGHFTGAGKTDNGDVGDDINVGDFLGKNAKRECGAGRNISEALGSIGFTDAKDTFCSFPFSYSEEYGGLGKNGGTKQKCLDGTKFDASGSKNDQRKGFNQIVGTTPQGKEVLNGLAPEEQYVQLWRTFQNGCSDGNSVNIRDVQPGDAAGNKSYIIKIVGKDGKVKDAYVTTPDSDNNDKQSIDVDTKLTCKELAKRINDTAAAYATWVGKHPDATGTVDTGDAPSNKDEDADAKPQCTIDNIGWILCPVMRFMGKLNDAAFGALNNFLEIRPSVITDTATRDAWEAFRNIANVAFVIAFLVIIYSQITGAGVSNYGVKRMIPRLIMAAVFVNVSYFICVVLVDISNILGASIFDLLKDFGKASTDAAASNNGKWEELIGGAMTVALVGIAIVAIVMILILAPTVLIAVAATLLILVARQAFIIVLIMLSPLAFVAYILPSTEKWFKKWWKALTTTLMVYPIIALVFGASTMVSTILMRVASGPGDDQLLLKLVALAVLGIPLFAVPALIKGSLSAAGAVGAKIAGIQDRANRRSSRAIKESRLGEAKSSYDRWRQKNKVEARLGNGKITKTGAFLHKRGIIGDKGRDAFTKVGGAAAVFDQSKYGRKLGGTRAAAKAVNELSKMTAEDEAAANSLINYKNVELEGLRKLAQGGESDGLNGKDINIQMAAIRKVIEAGDDRGIADLVDNAHEFNPEVKKFLSQQLLKSTPKWIGSAEAAAIGSAESGPMDSKQIIKEQIKKGVYNTQNLANASSDEAAMVHEAVTEMAASGDPDAVKAAQKTMDDARVALDDPKFGASKGRANLEKFASPSTASTAGAPGSAPGTGSAPVPTPTAPPVALNTPPAGTAPPPNAPGSAPTPQSITQPYSKEDMRNMGAGQLKILVDGSGGMNGLSDGDIAKIINAVRPNAGEGFDGAGFEEIHNQLTQERNRRRGGGAGGTPPPGSLPS